MPVWAQDTEQAILNSPNPESQAEAQLRKSRERLLGEAKSANIEPADPADPNGFTVDTRAAYQKAWQQYYEYRGNGYSFRQGVFDWQHFSTKAIFVVVILLVLVGVYFAGVQFHTGKRSNNPSDTESEVQISWKGITVRSPVLGVVILAISLAFFYLYLIYVYPIENVF